MYFFFFKIINIISIDMLMIRIIIKGLIMRYIGIFFVVGLIFIVVNLIYNIYIFFNLLYVLFVSKLL